MCKLGEKTPDSHPCFSILKIDMFTFWSLLFKSRIKSTLLCFTEQGLQGTVVNLASYSF